MAFLRRYSVRERKDGRLDGTARKQVKSAVTPGSNAGKSNQVAKLHEQTPISELAIVSEGHFTRLLEVACTSAATIWIG